MTRLAFATCRKKPDLTPDDALVRNHLPTGWELDAIPWDSESADWTAYDAVVLRSTWDYHLRFAEFDRWLDELGRAGVRLWNPVEIVRWNADKTYLRDLAERGIEVVPTLWPSLQQGRDEPVDLSKLLADAGWSRAVVKPTVSATAFGAFVVEARSTGSTVATAATAEAEPIGMAASSAPTAPTAPTAVTASDQAAFDALRRNGGVMVQPFLEEVVRHGEWSLVFLGGRCSHAVIKTARPGDYRVQTDFGGGVRAEEPSESLVAWASRCVAVAEASRAVGSPLLYARVDAVEIGAEPHLMELELIEPDLFLGTAAGAARRFASAIEKSVSARRPPKA